MYGVWIGRAVGGAGTGSGGCVRPLISYLFASQSDDVGLISARPGWKSRPSVGHAVVVESAVAVMLPDIPDHDSRDAVRDNGIECASKAVDRHRPKFPDEVWLLSFCFCSCTEHQRDHLILGGIRVSGDDVDVRVCESFVADRFAVRAFEDKMIFVEAFDVRGYRTGPLCTLSVRARSRFPSEDCFVVLERNAGCMC